MRTFFLCLFLIFTTCDYFRQTPKKNISNDIATIEQMIAAYNNYESNVFMSYFHDDVNMFEEHGRGNIRIATGKTELRNHYKTFFERKENQTEIVNLIHISPWVITHQKITAKSKSKNGELPKELNVALAYRFEKQLVIDVMILGFHQAVR